MVGSILICAVDLRASGGATCIQKPELHRVGSSPKIRGARKRGVAAGGVLRMRQLLSRIGLPGIILRRWLALTLWESDRPPASSALPQFFADMKKTLAK